MAKFRARHTKITEITENQNYRKLSKLPKITEIVLRKSEKTRVNL